MSWEAYQAWILDNIKEPYGKCAEYTLLMVDQFPELTRVRGHYGCPIWGDREHWWLKTPDGAIVDPTMAQFPTKGIAATYTEVDESRPEELPTGKCRCCGSYCYHGARACSKRCEEEILAELGEY